MYTLYGRNALLTTDEPILSIDPGITSLGIYVGTKKESLFFSVHSLPDDESVYEHVNTYLGELKSMGILDRVKVVIIERQVKQNYRMVRLSQHIITYLAYTNEVIKGGTVLEVNSTLKMKYDPSFKTLNSATIKKKIVEVAIAKLRKCKNDVAADLIESSKTQKARSDLSDAYIQMRALVRYIKHG